VSEHPEEYLGDGLYAKFDGFEMTLRAPREFGDHWVVLEPATMAKFLDYAERVGMISKRKGREL